MRKMIFVLACCLVVCGFAYRWGDTRWEDAKITAVEKLHYGISKMIFPQVYLYKYDKTTLLYNDLEQVFMPVVTSFRSSGTSGELDVNSEELGQDSGLSDMVECDTEDREMEPDSQEEVVQEEASEVVSNVVTENSETNILTKKVEINRLKLQEFDYLRQNFYQVDNTTTIGSDQLNVTKLMQKDMTLSEYGEGPKILIYHTHSQEGYANSVPGDENTSVVALGAELSRILSEKYGIAVLHHKGQYDVPNHANAYANALPNLEQILRENPAIEVVIDMHRDGVPASTHFVTEINGKQTAQIMFFNGLSRTTTQGNLSYLENPYIEDNLAFSFQMQLAAAEYYPGLTRKIYLKGYRYNMHLAPKSMLVEVGAQTNTFEEAKNAMEPLADLLALVLTEE